MDRFPNYWEIRRFGLVWESNGRGKFKCKSKSEIRGSFDCGGKSAAYAQDDGILRWGGREQATTTATADPCGMTNKRTSNGNSKYRDSSLCSE
jgi:hypothetical protein